MFLSLHLNKRENSNSFKMAEEKKLKEMFDAINKGETYKVLTKDEYEDLVARASNLLSTSTPKYPI